MVGRYLDGKKVFNIEVGFLSHSKGTISMNQSGELKGRDVIIFSAETYCDVPLGEKGLFLLAYNLKIVITEKSTILSITVPEASSRIR